MPGLFDETNDAELNNWESQKGTRISTTFNPPAKPWATACLKYINIFCSLVGLALLGVGIYAYNEWATAEAIAPGIIVLGFSITILAGMGLWGACSSDPEESWVLRVYFFAMLFLMVIFLICGSFCFVYRSYVQDTIDNNFDSVIPWLPSNTCDCTGCTGSLDPGLMTEDELSHCKEKLKTGVKAQFVAIGCTGLAVAVLIALACIVAGRVLRFSVIAKPLLSLGSVLTTVIGLGITAFGLYVATTLQHIEEVSWGAYGIVGIGILIVLVSGMGIRIMCCEAMTSGAVCSFFWSVALVALLLVGLSSLCVYQMGNLPTYVDDNFDAGGKIRENMGLCYCNADMFSCGSEADQIQCNARNSAGALLHYNCTGGLCELNNPNGTCTQHNITTGCCLTLFACKLKFEKGAQSNLLACGILGLYVFVYLCFALAASFYMWQEQRHKIEESPDPSKRREERSASIPMRDENGGGVRV